MNKFEKVSKEQYVTDMPNGSWVEWEDIKLPRRATKYSAGYDIYATRNITLYPNESVKIPTGIRVLLDDDKFLAIFPRSGLGFKYRLQLDNSVGIIDADYSQSDNEGHIWIKMTNDNKEGKTVDISRGDAIAQGIILSYHKTVDDTSEGVRNGGFGSTGGV